MSNNSSDDRYEDIEELNRIYEETPPDLAEVEQFYEELEREHNILLPDDYDDSADAIVEDVGINLVSSRRPKLVRDENWDKLLIKNEEHGNLAIIANGITAFRHGKDWEDVLWWDEFSLRTTARTITPWGRDSHVWDDDDDIKATEWLHQHNIYLHKTETALAIETVAKEQPYNPVQEYLLGIEWDRVPRLDTWLTTYLGVEHSNYAEAVGPKWMISGVARIFRPGCKADCSLILEGPQGIKKSTALRALGDPWFTDQLPEVGSKDSYIQLHGVWIVELAELDSLNRAESSKVKAFLSQQVDRIRMPYNRRSEEFPRQCIFAGSTNDDAYLKDETGARRFWPVKCGVIDIDSLRQDRDQLWAEAVERFRTGEKWYLVSRYEIKLAEEQQAQRFVNDAWEETIGAALKNRNEVSIEEVLRDCLGKPKDTWTNGDKIRVGKCLKSLGWKSCRGMIGGVRATRYQR